MLNLVLQEPLETCMQENGAEVATTGSVDYDDKRGYRREHLEWGKLRRVANFSQILEKLSAVQKKK